MAHSGRRLAVGLSASLCLLSALTAGLFLKEFVGETPWVHVDIAGPASTDKEQGHVAPGGTGFAVATIVEHLVPRE